MKRILWWALRTAPFLGFCFLATLPVTAQGGSGTQHYFYTESNLHIVQSYGVNYPFSVQDVTVASGAPLPASVSSALTSFALTNDTEHVYFISSNQHVNELYGSSTGTWTHNDISAAVGSPFPVLTSSLTSYQDSLGEHVAYLGANQHLYLLYYSYSTSHWSLTDLTSITNGALAATNSALSSFTDHYGEYIAYEGTNQHIYWTYLTFGGSPWANQDITAAAGGVLAASGSALSTFADSIGERTFYIGPEQHTYQLLITSAWVEQDLTALSGASPAVAGSSLTSFTDKANSLYGPGGGHLFYWSQAGTGQMRVTELLFNGSAWSPLNITESQPTPAPALASLPGYETASGIADYEQVASLQPVYAGAFCPATDLVVSAFRYDYVPPDWVGFCPTSAEPAPTSSLTGFINP